MNVISSKDIQLSCKAEIGKPDPRLTWIFNEELIGSTALNENSLTVSIESIQNGGVYTCIAMNEHASDNATVEIFVQGECYTLMDGQTDKN